MKERGVHWEMKDLQKSCEEFFEFLQAMVLGASKCWPCLTSRLYSHCSSLDILMIRSTHAQ